VRRALVSLGLLGIVVVLVAAACGATAGPNSGELMFDFGGDDEDAGAGDGGRTPLSLDAGQ